MGSASRSRSLWARLRGGKACFAASTQPASAGMYSTASSVNVLTKWLRQAAIERAGSGVIIYLDQEGKGNGHLALMKSIPFKKAGLSQAEAYKKAGFEADARSFRPAAEILADMKVKSVVLLTNNPEKAEDLRRASINVAGTKPTENSK